jgi:predicted  nucleic acid-binding Zn-ribbon protein
MDEKFKELILSQFGEINKQFEKMDQRFDRIDGELSSIKSKLGEHDVRLESIERKQKEHDLRFNNLDGNVDIIARWTKQLVDNDDEIADLFAKRKSKR